MLEWELTRTVLNSVTLFIMKRKLAVLTYAPIPGKIKTQLCPPLDPQVAAELHESFLLDTLEKADSVPDTELVLYYAPLGTLPMFRNISPNRTKYLLQRGRRSIGERLAYCFEQLSELGSAVVVIGTDSPTLPARSLELAFDVLASGDVDVVFGPTSNKGCYLVGMTASHPEVFRDYRADTVEALDKCIENAAKLDLGWYLLPKWHKVENLPDLRRLKDEFMEGRIEDHIAPRTRICVNNLAQLGVI